MSLLVRATELVGRPVVTLAGEDVAQIKDVIYDASGGAVSGFTLNGRGLFSGPRKVALSMGAVVAIGPDAVMVQDEEAFTGQADIVDAADVRSRNVLGNRVLTDTGTELGTVVDVIVQVGEVADVAGYEVKAVPSLQSEGNNVLIPLPDALAVSGEALIVPNGAVEYISHDLAGFGAAVSAFRSHLKADADAVQ